MPVFKHCVSNKFGNNSSTHLTSKHANLKYKWTTKVNNKILVILPERDIYCLELLPNFSDYCKKWPHVQKKKWKQNSVFFSSKDN